VCRVCIKKDIGGWSRVAVALGLVVLVLIILLLIRNSESLGDRQSKASQHSTIDQNTASPSLDIADSEPGPSLIQSEISNSTSESSVNFRLVVLSPSDQKAVVLNVQGQTQLITVGDQLGEGDFEVLQITSEKLVLKHPASGEIIWMFQGEGKEWGRIQVFSSQIENSETPPSSISIESSPGVNQ